MLIALVNRGDRLHGATSKPFEGATRGKIESLSIVTSALKEYEITLRSGDYSEDEIAVNIRAFTKIKNVCEEPLNSKAILAAIIFREKYQ